MISNGLLNRIALKAFIACFIVVVFLYVMIFLIGERFPFGILFLYGPRFYYFVPVFILIFLSLLLGRSVFLWSLVFGFLTVFIFSGVVINLSEVSCAPEKSLRVVTYNVHRWSVSFDSFSSLIENVSPDLVAIQECAPSNWPTPEGWYRERFGESIILSRYPILEKDVYLRGRSASCLYCKIETPYGLVDFYCIDLLTPRRVVEALYEDLSKFRKYSKYKSKIVLDQRWLESLGLERWINNKKNNYKIIAGDYNLVTDSNIYKNIWSNYINAFDAEGKGFGFTKKTKINVFEYGSRIDHILTTSNISTIKCWLGPDLGSDHFPLIADLVIN